MLTGRYLKRMIIIWELELKPTPCVSDSYTLVLQRAHTRTVLRVLIKLADSSLDQTNH